MVWYCIEDVLVALNKDAVSLLVQPSMSGPSPPCADGNLADLVDGPTTRHLLVPDERRDQRMHDRSCLAQWRGVRKWLLLGC